MPTAVGNPSKHFCTPNVIDPATPIPTCASRPQTPHRNGQRWLHCAIGAWNRQWLSLTSLIASSPASHTPRPSENPADPVRPFMKKPYSRLNSKIDVRRPSTARISWLWPLTASWCEWSLGTVLDDANAALAAGFVRDARSVALPPGTSLYTPSSSTSEV